MTDDENLKDSEGLDRAHGTSDVVPRPKLLVVILVAIALTIGIDLLVDRVEGGSVFHVVVELAVMVVALAGATLLARDLAAARAETRTLARRLQASHRDAERYRAEAAELLRGLSETIDRQLGRWGLTEAEKEVALLLLKGLSLKEVADVRGTSERTARTQARAVYAKAGLEGRAELSAFFLEDLLPAADP